MEFEDRLDYIRSYFQTAKFAESGLLPVSDRDIEEEICSFDAYVADKEEKEEREEEFGPSPELRKAFGEFE